MENQNITYRENAISYEIYYALRESVEWHNFSPEQARNALKNTTYDVVVFEGERAVGMGRLVGDGLYLMIVDVVVCPEYQGQGIGRQIMELLTAHVEEHLPEGGRVSIQLVAEKGKEPFYEHLGFKRIPHEYCGSGMRKVVRKA